jgi:hypothetical protein
MVWLYRLVASKRARFVTARITGDLLGQEDRLLARYGAQAIVNATGLGSYQLAADTTVTPLRGALIRVVNDGSRFPKVEQALAVSHDDTNGADAEDIVFIVPRNNNVLILGGMSSFFWCWLLFSLLKHRPLPLRIGPAQRTQSRLDSGQPRDHPHAGEMQQLCSRPRKCPTGRSTARAGSAAVPRLERAGGARATAKTGRFEEPNRSFVRARRIRLHPVLWVRTGRSEVRQRGCHRGTRVDYGESESVRRVCPIFDYSPFLDNTYT